MSSGPSKRKLKPRARGVDLRRADAQVEQHAVHLGDAQPGQQARQLGEVGVVDREARVLHLARRRHRIGVTVQGQQAAGGRQALEQQARVPAAAEGAVDVGACRVGHQRINRFVQQHGGVPRGRRHGGGNGCLIHPASHHVVAQHFGHAGGQHGGFVRVVPHLVPQLEARTHANQQHVAFEAGPFAQLGCDQHP